MLKVGLTMVAAVLGAVMLSDWPLVMVNALEQANTPVAELVNVTVPTLAQVVSPAVHLLIWNTSVVVEAALPKPLLFVQPDATE